MSSPIQLVLLTVVLLSSLESGMSYYCDVARIGGAVLQAILPIMNEMRDDLRSMGSDLSSFNESMNKLNGDFEEHKSHLSHLDTKLDTLESKLASVNDASVLMNEGLSSLKSDLGSLNGSVIKMSGNLDNHQNSTEIGLANVQTSLHTSQSSIITNAYRQHHDLSYTLRQLNAQLSTHDSKLDSKLDVLNSKLDYKLNNPPIYSCGDTGGWRRVVYLNMNDSNTNCPCGWQLTGHSIRTCGRVSTGSLTCDSVTFSVSGGEYTRVCGLIKAYQVGYTDAFEAYHIGEVTTIDGAYVSGVSLTHGIPREHIWTFAAGGSERDFARNDSCPCDAIIDISVPPFVDEDYFCESGVNSGSASGFHPDDPLWDGQGCSSTSTCCSYKSPPYFTKQLPNPTTDDIEARICRWSYGEDTPLELIELYAQ